jgi:hypothetical protein
MSNQFGRLSQVAPIGIEQPQAVPLVPTQHPPANLAHFFSTLAPHQLVLVDPMGLLGGFMPFTPVSTPAQVGHQIASINTMSALGRSAAAVTSVNTPTQVPNSPVKGRVPQRRVTSRASTNGSGRSADGTRKAGRPLNSWIAFRCK